MPQVSEIRKAVISYVLCTHAQPPFVLIPSSSDVKVRRRWVAEVDPCAPARRRTTAGSVVARQAHSSTPGGAGHSAPHNDSAADVLTVKVRVRICGRRTRALSPASGVTLKVRCTDGDFENMTSPTNQK